ncbi:MAG: hypothetical protein ACOY3P_20380 [Planctomycetota bacterium]
MSWNAVGGRAIAGAECADFRRAVWQAKFDRWNEFPGPLDMNYYCVDSKRGPDGAAPALPDGTGFLVLAEVGKQNSPWAVVQCSRRVPQSHVVRALPGNVRDAIESAQQYPPAFALARNDLEGRSKSELSTPEAFMNAYRQALLRHLRGQGGHGFLLAEAVGEESGYLYRGCFYWVLDLDPSTQTVRWVSDDYFIYENPAADFDFCGHCPRIRGRHS